MVVINILIFIIVIGIIILIHEFGHFFFARRAEILCHEFSIGMGPIVYQKIKGETKYTIRALPLGGYVAMAGETEDQALLKKDMSIGLRLDDNGDVTHIVNEGLACDVSGIAVDFDLYGIDMKPLYIDLNVEGEIKRYSVLRNAGYQLKEKDFTYIETHEKSFVSKTLWQRFLVIVAGPVMNFILAFALYFIVAAFTYAPQTKDNIVGKIIKDAPAYVAGVREGDRITSINGVTVSNWSEILDQTYQANDGKLDLILNNNKSITVLAGLVIQSVGITNYDDDREVISIDAGPILKSVSGKAAGKLEVDDRVTSINGVAITSWADMILYFKNNKDISIATFVVQRDGKEVANINVDLLSEETLNKLGSEVIVVSAGFSVSTKFEFGYFITYPFRALGNAFSEVGNTLGLLFTPKSNVGVGDLSGFIGIYSLVSRSVSQGIISLIAFTAFISINIGLLNLLPIPALDGGRLVFIAYEAITKKKVNRKVEGTLITITFVLLLGLIIFVTYKDIIRLIQGVF